MMDLMSDVLSINSLLRQQLNQQRERSTSKMPSASTWRTTSRSTPKDPSHAIEDLGSHVKLTMRVPGARDVEVEFLQEVGTWVLYVRGRRLVSRHGSVTESTFAQAFQLEDDDIDVDAIQVKLASGILTVIAPKKERQFRQEHRRPEITTEGAGRDHGHFSSTPVEKTNDARASGSLAGSTGEAETSAGQHHEQDDFFISEDEDI
jgi:HSP20 family molecular chaperone IbpA